MKRIACFSMALMVVIPCFASAQVELGETPTREGAVDTYGSDETEISLSAFAFQPLTSAVTYSSATGPHGIFRTNAAGATFFVAPISLPAGAAVVRLELQGCDSAPVGDIAIHLRQQPRTTFSAVTVASVTSVTQALCTTYSTTLPAPHTVDNANNTYFIEADLQNNTLANRLAAVRVSYRLQVSPPPATATFPSDVPTTHPFFRFVEALAASGLTGGCGAGTFCPDSPVTRGQMAVFLSVALGLHWAP